MKIKDIARHSANDDVSFFAAGAVISKSELSSGIDRQSHLDEMVFTINASTRRQRRLEGMTELERNKTCMEWEPGGKLGR